MRLVIPIVLFSFINVTQAASAINDKEIASVSTNIAEHWLIQTSNTSALVKGKCWKKNITVLSRSLIGVAFELDLVNWLDSKNGQSSQTRYKTMYDLSRIGLENRMANNRYQLVNSNKTNRFWTNLVYKNGKGHTANLKSLLPVDLEIYRDTVSDRFGVLINSAIEDCPLNESIPTQSLLLLVYLTLPYLNDHIAVELVGSTIRTWDQASRKGHSKVASKWLNFVAYLVSRFDAQQTQLLSKNIHDNIRNGLVTATSDRIRKILNNKKINADTKVTRLWRYQSLLSAVSQSEMRRYNQFIEPVSVDPTINLTIPEAVELLVLAKRLDEEGSSSKAANILSNLLLWEIGTAETGLNMTRPIDNKNRIKTPYPIWLSLVPAYHELVTKMQQQSNQLTAEQYKTVRMFSRSQYVSGIAEEGFWINFENVVN